MKAYPERVGIAADWQPKGQQAGAAAAGCRCSISKPLGLLSQSLSIRQSLSGGSLL